MAVSFQFELVTPERMLLSQEVQSVIVPGVEGDIGVLPDHAALITALRPGVLTVGDELDSTRYAVANGYVEVLGDRVTVMVEDVVAAADINKATVEQFLQEAVTALSTMSEEEPEYASVHNQAAFAEIQLEMLKER